MFFSFIIVIPDSVTRIGGAAFKGCYSLSEFIIKVGLGIGIVFQLVCRITL